MDLNYWAFGIFCGAGLYLAIWSIIRLAKSSSMKKSGENPQKARTKTKDSSEKIVTSHNLSTTLALPDDNSSQVAQCTVIGDRESQQDSVLVDEDLPQSMKMAVLCDGMGGMEGGAQASSSCVKAFQADCHKGISNPQFFLQTEAGRLNELVLNLSNDNGEPLHAGTTFVTVLLQQNRAYWMSIGDSRIYLWRNGMLIRLTVDHNYTLQLDEEVASGKLTVEQAAGKSQREALVSFLGIEELTRADINSCFPTLPGDIFLLCSDGLTKALTDSMIADFFANHTEETVGTMAKALIAKAMQYKRRRQDNTTVAILRCR